MSAEREKKNVNAKLEPDEFEAISTIKERHGMTWRGMFFQGWRSELELTFDVEEPDDSDEPDEGTSDGSAELDVPDVTEEEREELLEAIEKLTAASERRALESSDMARATNLTAVEIWDVLQQMDEPPVAYARGDREGAVWRVVD